MKITVLGSGGWGTALALVLFDNGHDVTLWSHTPEKAIQMAESRENPLLKDVHLPEGLHITGSLDCLTGADMVIHYDPWWNLAVQNQATDRAHRIGQTHVVNVYKLIMKDTIEENIMKLQERNKALAEQVLSGEELGSGNFTKEELLELLDTAW